jgi:hypothetical protein
MEIFINISLIVIIIISIVAILSPIIYLIYGIYMRESSLYRIHRGNKSLFGLFGENGTIKTFDMITCLISAMIGALFLLIIGIVGSGELVYFEYDCEKHTLNDEEVYICKIENHD